MYLLTIDHDSRAVSISDHPDFDAAHKTLLEYVVGADYYLKPIQTTRPHTSYELVQLLDDDDAEAEPVERRRPPRTTGHAMIEHHPEPVKLADSPYYVAVAAQRWISDHSNLWTHGAEADLGGRYPRAVLTAAQAEGRCWFSAGTLIREAAHLAGVEPITHPDEATLEALRHNAITTASRPTPSPAALAATVQELLPADTTAADTAALIWWYALITWGANAS
ncbi:MAG: hypothetical protein JWR37_3397 [Mycobacterium sp.]|nr:hypothetical protein [Mycobacterium sp.]